MSFDTFKTIVKTHLNANISFTLRFTKSIENSRKQVKASWTTLQLSISAYIACPMFVFMSMHHNYQHYTCQRSLDALKKGEKLKRASMLCYLFLWATVSFSKFTKFKEIPMATIQRDTYKSEYSPFFRWRNSTGQWKKCVSNGHRRKVEQRKKTRKVTDDRRQLRGVTEPHLKHVHQNSYIMNTLLSAERTWILHEFD